MWAGVVEFDTVTWGLDFDLNIRRIKFRSWSYIPCPCEGLGIAAFEVDEAGVGEEVWATVMEGKMLETRVLEE